MDNRELLVLKNLCVWYTRGKPVLEKPSLSRPISLKVSLMVCYDKTTCWKNKTKGTIGGDVDAGIVTTQMMLEEAELELATTWVGVFNHQ